MSSVGENTCTEEGRSIPKGWVETTLGEIAIINPRESIKKGEIATNIPMAYLDSFSKKIQTFEKKEFKGGTKFRNGDTLMARITPCLENGKTSYVDILEDDEIGFGSTEYIVLREKENFSNKHFLFYLSISPKFRELAIKLMTGTSGRQRVQTNSLINRKLILPKYEEQKAIANILTAFDDKIENLQAQNKTLEQTAQTIFKEWFGKYQVDDELPDGWRVGNLGEVTKSVGGTTPSTKHEGFWNGNIFWSSPKDLSNNEYIYLLSTEKKITENGLKKISSGLLPKNTLLLSSRAPVGYLALTNVELAINQGYIAILPSQYFSNYYTFLWLKKNMKKVINSANGSTFLEISKSAFRTIDCVIPEKSKIEDFDKIVAPFFKKTLSNQIQIQTLKKTRDTVLPKLMSGQIRVNAFKA